jgi:hypothetical protein
MKHPDSAVSFPFFIVNQTNVNDVQCHNTELKTKTE